MDVRDLNVFLAVAARLNFTRAGEDVHLSQPSVSVRIHGIEEELGVKLFEQVGKKISLTEAGRLLEPYARRAVGALDDARHAIEEFQGIERGALRIGASTTPGMYMVPRIIAAFNRQHPKIELFLSIKDTRQVEEAVLRNEVDFGFVGGHLTHHDVETQAWLTDEIVLILSPTHPLTKKNKVKLKDLAGERFIFREQGSATQYVLEKSLGEVNLRAQAVIELSNPEAVKQGVQHGLGIAFISKFTVESELRAKTLIALKVEGFEVTRQLKIIYRKEKHLSRAARAFIETAQKDKIR